MSPGHSMFRSSSHASLTWARFSGLAGSIEAFSWVAALLLPCPSTELGHYLGSLLALRLQASKEASHLGSQI